MPWPSVLFPDATAVTVSYLRAALAGRSDTTPVEPRVPTPRPGQFLLIRRLGGQRQTIISDSPQIGVEAWAATDEDAHDLAQLARALMHAMAGTTQGDVAVYRVDELAGPANLPDPQSAQPRYAQTFQVHLRGAAL